MKTYSLLLCDTQTFLTKRNKIVKLKALDHGVAMDAFFETYEKQLINQTIAVFCYEDNTDKYGYLYVASNNQVEK